MLRLVAEAPGCGVCETYQSDGPYEMMIRGIRAVHLDMVVVCLY